MTAALTPWFPGNVKPARKGVYQQRCGFGKDIGYQYWDGVSWGPWERAPEDAEEIGRRSKWTWIDGDPWRGLAAPPR